MFLIRNRLRNISFNNFVKFNFSRFADEISRQLISSDAKLIFGLSAMSNVLQQAVAMTKRQITIIYAKEKENESLPKGGIDINDLITTKGRKTKNSFMI